MSNKIKKSTIDVYRFDKLKSDLEMNESEIHNYIAESFINGQKKQCYSVFLDLSLKSRSKFVKNTNNLEIIKFLLTSEINLIDNSNTAIEYSINNQ